MNKLKKIAEIDKKISELEKLYKNGRLTLLEKADELSSKEKATYNSIMHDTFMALMGLYQDHTSLYIAVHEIDWKALNPIEALDAMRVKTSAYFEKYEFLHNLKNEANKEPLTLQVRSRQVPLLKAARDLYQIEKELLKVQKEHKDAQKAKIETHFFMLCLSIWTAFLTLSSYRYYKDPNTWKLGLICFCVLGIGYFLTELLRKGKKDNEQSQTKDKEDQKADQKETERA